MTAAHARRSGSQGKMASPAAADLISMFAQRNPSSSHGDLAEVGRLVAEFSAAAAKLSPDARRRLIRAALAVEVNERAGFRFGVRKRNRGGLAERAIAVSAF